MCFPGLAGTGQTLLLVCYRQRALQMNTDMMILCGISQYGALNNLAGFIHKPSDNSPECVITYCFLFSCIAQDYTRQVAN